ncbi:MAG: phosphoribosylformylglycinamidine synthase subunit PurL [Chloroherpetonaceae bacterium]|nr:phosphoribosylformylglycinamidine synthase subunit PurL [Chloroherpetonaceae bacterium]MCS7210768.1 phosphoribosylformylglycinamidine synthase subunit PurL [Chloroherpetonaceae bacterium]MDW8019512.1 phosphoribosylformylglycinamidine synthase subunit PurL [Chloroherpetonaceae bacterium]
MTEPTVTLELAKQHGLLEEEYEKILQILGRTPTYTELGIFAVMWSEHCSYKNSIAVLRTLPRSGKHLLAKAGEENAGLVDIGDGLAVAFKIESHNHPSAIEPYQGAATGVGGIHRDIFTMGARPIAALNSLRFGNPADARVQYLLEGVVRGIGDYGNSFGVATVAGEVYFDDCYQYNPLVNAMSVGIVEHHKVARAIASGEGNPVLIVGAATGRDGIHGATFASEELSEASEDKRPSVQVGDPFTEKLLLEATLEAIESGYVVGIQDMGAAGLTCSSSEMSARAIEKTGIGGMELNLDLVPTREKNMTAYEIMLSESQERMLIVAKKGYEQKIIDIFAKWDLSAVVIGKVTSDGMLRVWHHGELKAEIPAPALVLGGGAPVYYRDAKEKKPDVKFPPLKPDTEIDFQKEIFAMLARPNIASKHWIFEQYDTMVRTNTVVGAGIADAAVVRIKGTTKALAMKIDCNAKYVYLNPRRGAQIAVAECARNIACTGAKPLAITNCLNFGNPYKPEVYFQFKEAVAGMGEACTKFETPVTGGNVSFYNESTLGGESIAVYPTPTIGMIGLIENVEHIITATFKEENDAIYLIGEVATDLNGSEFIAYYYGELGTDAPPCDLDREKALQDFLVEAARQKLLRSAHDISDGGLVVALAECAMMNSEHQMGFEVNLTAEQTDTAIQSVLFSEAQGRVVVSVAPEKQAELELLLEQFQLPYQKVGRTQRRVAMLSVNGKVVLNAQVEELHKAYFFALESRLTEPRTV